jgi:hypothetical protein
MLCCVLKILYLLHNYTLNIETAIKKEKIILQGKDCFLPMACKRPEKLNSKQKQEIIVVHYLSLFTNGVH